MKPTNCYCGAETLFQNCCERYINGTQKAPTAEALMRSRYSAYATHSVDYLLATTHPLQQKYYSKIDILDWAISNQWLKLEILAVTENTVEFKAHYLDKFNQNQIHHEKSTFIFENGLWFYVDGQFY